MDLKGLQKAQAYSPFMGQLKSLSPSHVVRYDCSFFSSQYKFPQEQIVYHCMTFPSLFKCGSLKWVGLDLYVALSQNN